MKHEILALDSPLVIWDMQDNEAQSNNIPNESAFL